MVLSVERLLVMIMHMKQVIFTTITTKHTRGCLHPVHVCMNKLYVYRRMYYGMHGTGTTATPHLTYYTLHACEQHSEDPTKWWSREAHNNDLLQTFQSRSSDCDVNFRQ